MAQPAIPSNDRLFHWCNSKRQLVLYAAHKKNGRPHRPSVSAPSGSRFLSGDFSCMEIGLPLRDRSLVVFAETDGDVFVSIDHGVRGEMNKSSDGCEQVVRAGARLPNLHHVWSRFLFRLSRHYSGDMALPFALWLNCANGFARTAGSNSAESAPPARQVVRLALAVGRESPSFDRGERRCGWQWAD